MNLLLDTHILLWWLNDDPTLTPAARAAIADGNNLAFVSAATVWEIRIKEGLGKLILPGNFGKVLEAQPFLGLDITTQHAHAVASLPPHHRDPFDRMLVAQALVENLTVVSRDAQIPRYPVRVIPG
ncbi:MAG: type II toxin-antitoxin system VapC family toxin [Deferrisomatales bacterium]|nr:type II toxin-antitoxin system VapC family toxin [Deferrisomatales bacterium]